MLSGLAPAIRATLRMLVQDPLLGRAITYKHHTGQTAFDDDLGHPVDQFEALSIRAIPLRHTEQSVRQSGESSIQVGDHLYIMRMQDLTAVGLSKSSVSQKDLINDDGEDRKIQSIQWILDFAVSITVAG